MDFKPMLLLTAGASYLASNDIFTDDTTIQALPTTCCDVQKKKDVSATNTLESPR